MSRFARASYVIWHCQYHLVWVPKYRFRILQGPVGREVYKCVMIQPAVRVRSSGIECAGGSRPLVGKGATEIIGIGLDGHIERSDGDKVVQRISVSQETALLG
jgi:hypothetical protein